MIVQQRVVLLLLGLWSSVFKGELRGTGVVRCGAVTITIPSHLSTTLHQKGSCLWLVGNLWRLVSGYRTDPVCIYNDYIYGHVTLAQVTWQCDATSETPRIPSCS